MTSEILEDCLNLTSYIYDFVGTTGLSRPLSVKTLLGRSSLSKASGAKSVSKMSGEEESLEKCAQSIVENSVSCNVLFVDVEFVIAKCKLIYFQ